MVSASVVGESDIFGIEDHRPFVPYKINTNIDLEYKIFC